MCNKRNGAVGVHCHRAMNWPIPVASTELWASCEPLRRHVLKIGRPYIRWDVYRFEIPPNRHVIPTLEILISRGFFAFLCFIPKITQKLDFENNFFFKKILYCFLCYLCCYPIFDSCFDKFSEKFKNREKQRKSKKKYIIF